AAAVEAALAAGQRLFGENRVQEAQAKYPPLKARYPDLRLHLIGPLQTNKVKEAVALFDAIETVDRPRLAEALAKEMARQQRRLPCFVEINAGREPQKAGIPPEGQDPAPYFAEVAAIAARNDLTALSMGMSADFEIAIASGASLVRL